MIPTQLTLVSENLRTDKMNISGGLKEVEKSAPSVVNILAYIIVGGLLTGVMVQLVSGGSITIPAILASFLNGTFLTNIISVFTNLTTVITTIVSLIVVVVLWKLFGLGKKGKGSGKVM